MSNVAIRVEQLSKKYRIGMSTEPYKAFRDVMTNAVLAPARKLKRLISRSNNESDVSTIWALRDLSFEVPRGEVLGIIGRNGAGKSTLLKILSRITEPTEGFVDVYGRLGALLEVGTGFHPELTGRENIYLNAAILGMKRREIDRKFDEIVSFAEVETFIDTPVKHYSSGMSLRLGFAVAAHLDLEILVIDEVLAVGDARFQRKCLGKMSDVAKQGRTVLFVSHDMGAVNSLTQRSMILTGGMISEIGPTPTMVSKYLRESFNQGDLGQRPNLQQHRRKRLIDPIVEIEDIWLDDRQRTPTMPMGQPFTIYMLLRAHKVVSGANITVMLRNGQGQTVSLFFSWDQDYVVNLSVGLHIVGLKICDLPISPGEYYADIGINQSVTTVAFDVVQNVPLFQVANIDQVLTWPERPWGNLHWTRNEWKEFDAADFFETKK